MNKEEEYLESLLKEIEIAKSECRNGIYKTREKLTDSQAIYAKNYLISHMPQYRIEFRKCPACAFEWDIMVIF